MGIVSQSPAGIASGRLHEGQDRVHGGHGQVKSNDGPERLPSARYRIGSPPKIETKPPNQVQGNAEHQNALITS